MALSPEAQNEIKEYLHRYLKTKVLALFGFVGIGAIAAILTASWNAAESAAQAVVDNPSRIAAELSTLPDFYGEIAIRATGLPVGTTVPFGGAITTEVRSKLFKQGWLPCNGEPVSRSEFKELYTAIGTAWGAPSALTFNLPDMRGRFVRGIDGTAGQDLEKDNRIPSNKDGNSGNMVGNSQNDSTRIPTKPLVVSGGSHTHTTNGKTWIAGATPEGTFPGGSQHPLATPSITGGPHGHNITTGGDLETRPKNVYVNWLIRYKGLEVGNN